MKSILAYLPSLACIGVAGAAMLVGRSAEDSWGWFLAIGILCLPEIRKFVFG